MPISIPKSLLVSQHCKYLLKSPGWHPGSSQHSSPLPYTKLLQLIDFPSPASHSYTTLPFWSWTLLVVLVLSLLLTPFIGLFLPTLPFLSLWFSALSRPFCWSCLAYSFLSVLWIFTDTSDCALSPSPQPDLGVIIFSLHTDTMKNRGQEEMRSNRGVDN